MHISGTTRIRILVIIVLLLIIWQIMKYWNDLSQKNNALLSQPSGAPVMVAVYYEALCPDSRFFINKQLLTTYQRAPSLIAIEYIPYGKATTSTNPDGSLRFECQHGKTECDANIVHACTIESIKNPTTRLEVIACMINNNANPLDALHRCANSYPDELEEIKKCYNSPHGKELLKMHGAATDALRPHMTFVPTVTLDGQQNSQALILKDLFTEVCRIASGRGPPPPVCEQ